MRRVRHNLPLVNPHWLTSQAQKGIPKGADPRLSLQLKWGWPACRSPDYPLGLFWRQVQHLPCQVIRHLPAPLWLFKDDQNWHHYDTVSSAPLGAAHQVPWTHMVQILSSNPSPCFHLLPIAVSSLNPAPIPRGPGDLTAEDLGIKSTEYLKQVCANHHSFGHLIQHSLCLAFYCWCRGRSYLIIIRDVVISTALRKSSCFHNSKDRNAG